MINLHIIVQLLIFVIVLLWIGEKSCIIIQAILAKDNKHHKGASK